MLVRNKRGEFAAGDALVLLDFLGVKKDAGPQKVAGDVELIASVPFRLAADGEAVGIPAVPDGIAAIPDGIAWTLSTFDLDRFSERIDPAGWDFKRYMENPVIEWAHRYDIPAIGKAEHIYADEKGLHGSIVFNSKDYDPFGWAIGQRVKAGVIRAGSVGFRVIEIELPDKETGKDGTTLIFRKQELLEFSICNVPANPFALTKTMAEGKPETTQELGGSMFWGGLINNL
ncbi:MAG: HK97 family phage prohead protease [Treponema sp.]|nr:HK97 family phage prohead protease [Treponema sp.]